MSGSPQAVHERALAAERGGDRAQALAIVEQGLADHPRSAPLFDSAGSLALRAGDAALAVDRFAQAAKLDPKTRDFTLNQAIALGALERHRAALELVRPLERELAANPRYWSIRANAARQAGESADAAASYERCLALDPRHAKALHGRARAALERGENDAPARFDRALASNTGDGDLWLGKAQALEVAGDMAGARRIADQLVAQAPGWLEALRVAAQMRLAAGETDFTAPYREAAAARPDDPNIPSAHIAVLASVERAAEAADIAAEARRRFPEIAHFGLAEAAHAGSAGDDERAETIFAALALDTTERALMEARHRLRRGEIERAETLLEKVIADPTMRHSGYALLGVVWRLTGDDRAHWLHGQDGLVRQIALQDGDRVLSRAIPAFDALHDRSSHPLGQSLRGGTQTRHALFQRHEAIYGELHRAILATLEAYRDALPPADGAHPLLAQRDAPWTVAGSWSVRLEGGGDRHASHIHPEGVVSSALHLRVPESSGTDEAGKEGWLELGRPPADLRLELGPVATIRPQPGQLVLFPSTLYHGTTPFAGGRRMTVAFDVVPVP